MGAPRDSKKQTGLVDDVRQEFEDVVQEARETSASSTEPACRT